MAEAISTDDTVLLAWGANSYGQLGIGNKEDTLRPATVALPTDILQDITHISGGGGHTLIISGGKVCGFGWNKCRQIGHTTPGDHVIAPEVVPVFEGMTYVSCGWNHSLLVNDGGEVTSCGSNAYGQLGAPGDVTDPVTIPRSVFGGLKIREVAAGLRHSIALTDVGGVYTWGNGKRGQLGHGKEGVMLSTLHTPKQVNNLRDVKCIHVCTAAYTCFTVSGGCVSLYIHSSAGGSQLLIHGKSGCVHCWGYNQYGQCTLLSNSVTKGLNDDIVTSTDGSIKIVSSPYMIKDVAMVTNVQCGWSHIFAITAEGQVFGWGRCDYGQLGVVYEDKYIATPTLIPRLQGVKQIACGSEHSMAITDYNELLCWGWNEHGMCATGDEANVTTPTKVTTPHTGQSPILVAAGAGHSLVLMRTT